MRRTELSDSVNLTKVVWTNLDDLIVAELVIVHVIVGIVVASLAANLIHV